MRSIHIPLIFFCVFSTLGFARHGLRHKDPARTITSPWSGFTTRIAIPEATKDVVVYSRISTSNDYQPFGADQSYSRNGEPSRRHTKDFSPPSEPKEKLAEPENSGGCFKFFIICGALAWGCIVMEAYVRLRMRRASLIG
jgi:hypothetical protein